MSLGRYTFWYVAPGENRQELRRHMEEVFGEWAELEEMPDGWAALVTQPGDDWKLGAHIEDAFHFYARRWFGGRSPAEHMGAHAPYRYTTQRLYNKEGMAWLKTVT